ncbi:MAG: hypothetical protein OHK0028_19450 [Deltaproteobacteria bacterium]
MIRRAPLREFFWWILRAQWGIALLLFARFTDAPRWAVGVAAAAGAAGAAMDRAGSPRATLSRIGSPISALFLAAASAEFLFGGLDLLASVSLLVLGIQSVRFLLPKRSRDGWQLCALALLEFLAAAAGTDAPAFALFAFLFFVVSAGAMWALHDREAEDAGRPEGAYAVPARTAAAALLAAGVAGIFATAVLFAVIPRLEFRRSLHRTGSAEGVAGFSDAITLREVTRIKTDRRVVARVEFPDPPPGLSPPDLHLRGAVYSRYGDGAWRRRDTSFRPVPRAGFQHIVGDAEAPYSTADITLEPADHPALFVYGHPARIEGSFAPVLSDGGGNYSLAPAGHPAVRYRVRFSARPPPWRNPPGMPVEDAVFPPEMEEIRALAEGIAGGAGDDERRAERIMAFFRSGFRYTLERPAADLREFLFRNRAGTCEHFAAGLALMLRGAGIPSRVAAGYLGGEWNPVGNYLIVRRSDAHAWVEAWIGGRWRTMDATPAAGGTSASRAGTGSIGLYADWLRQRWDKYVINYSMRMQADALEAGVRTARGTASAFLWRGGGDRSGETVRIAAWLILLCAPASLLLRRVLRARRAPSGERRRPGDPRLPRPYARLLRRLERGGFRRSPGEPMAEALGAAVRRHPRLSDDAARFLALYHGDRFGAVPLPPDLRKEAFRLADRLRPADRPLHSGKRT